MKPQSRARVAGGAALLLLAGALHLTLRLTYGERTAYVHVRWAPQVDEFARAIVEREHGLTPVEFRELRTWGYFLSDLSTDNIRRLVQHPSVEDTHNIDRARFQILGSAERGDYTGGGAAWVPRMLEFFVRVALLFGLAGVAVGAYRQWR